MKIPESLKELVLEMGEFDKEEPKVSLMPATVAMATGGLDDDFK